MSAADAITLKAMRFHARVGVLPHEEHVAQPIEVDLTAERAPGRHAPDVVDYARLYELVAHVLGGPRARYLEEVAESVAAAVLREPGIDRARVAVRKPHVALPGPLAYAEVSIVRSRGG